MEDLKFIIPTHSFNIQVPQVPDTPEPVPLAINELPQIADSVYSNLGKNAGAAVMAAFHQLGGVQGLVNFGKANPEKFYTSIFPKVIASMKSADSQVVSENILDALDVPFREV